MHYCMHIVLFKVDKMNSSLDFLYSQMEGNFSTLKKLFHQIQLNVCMELDASQ